MNKKFKDAILIIAQMNVDLGNLYASMWDEEHQIGELSLEIKTWLSTSALSRNHKRAIRGDDPQSEAD